MTSAQIRAAVQFALNNSFWKGQLQNPMKLIAMTPDNDRYVDLWLGESDFYKTSEKKSKFKSVKEYEPEDMPDITEEQHEEIRRHIADGLKKTERKGAK